jgi:DNA-binding CsgD family transcriptional regulator
MSPRGPQSPREREVFRHLVSLVALGKGRGQWDAATVVRVAETFLPHPQILRRQLDKAVNELEACQAEIVRMRKERSQLKVRIQRLEGLAEDMMSSIEPHVGPPLRTVQLNQSQLDLLELMKTGIPTKVIAEQLGISYAATRNRIYRLNAILGVHSRSEAVVAVMSGAVEVQGLAGGSDERDDVAD